MLKDLVDRAKRVAKEHLPDDVLAAGRKLGRTVAAHAPAPVAEAIHYVTERAEATFDVAFDGAGSAAPRREDPRAVLERVKTKAARGLKPEDRLVVVYATPDEAEEVRAIEKILEGIEAEVRHNDLRREPQTARQLARLTGVMVPPYVFINGRHWGNRYDLESLAVSGDLPRVVANLMDELSDEARRIGHLQESFSDEMSVPNILDRWRRGHILCVDDLDSWFEVERDGTERFYYQGGPRPVEDMTAVATEIVAAVEVDEYEAVWQLEPSVHLP